MSSYIEKTLGEKEDLVHKAQLHWLYFAVCYGIIAITAIAALLIYIFVSQTLLVLLLPLFGLVIGVYRLLLAWELDIGVTNQRVVLKTGLLTRSTEEIPLDEIEEVRLNQGLIGRMLDYGRVVVTGTGRGDIKFPVFADPMGLRRAMESARHQYEQVI